MRRAMVPDIRITQRTRERLALLVRLLRDYPDAEVIEFLDQELMRAAVVPAADMPPNVATPGTRLIYRDLIADVPHEAVLVYPGFCHEIPDGLSLLSPAGCCLLGLTEGQAMRFIGWTGLRCDVALERVLLQPAPEWR